MEAFKPRPWAEEADAPENADELLVIVYPDRALRIFCVGTL
jgi:hypothetical protein